MIGSFTAALPPTPFPPAPDFLADLAERLGVGRELALAVLGDWLMAYEPARNGERPGLPSLENLGNHLSSAA